MSEPPARQSSDEETQQELHRVKSPDESSLAIRGNEHQDGIQMIDRALRDTSDAATLKAEHQIFLLDRTKAQDLPSASTSDNGLDDAERLDSEVPTPGAGSVNEPLARRSTRDSIHHSVRHHVNKQKYRRYQSDRFHNSDVLPEEGSRAPPVEGQEATPAQRGYLERGRAKAKNLMKRKRNLGVGTDEDSIIDILYENQRGAFMFGVPMFSSSSLLNFDPKAWQSHNFRSSPVDIRNAQVPDPSWEWSWKSWYVDMSRDVDEEGWEYSFSFQKGFSWHGNHPWFTSFVRRRRWLRKRIRKHAMRKTKDKSHELTAEYFTIHPKTVKTPSPEGSIARSADWARAHARMEDEEMLEKIEITDIGSLTRVLRKAAVDRQKLVAVRKFIDEGGDELFYLSDQMSEIMSLFVFQSSRRQLLADLLHRFDAISARKESLSGHVHTDEEIAKKHEAAAKQADNLLKAVHAADEQVKRLEYWSDIKSMAQRGEALLAIDDKHWDATKWQGLDTSAAGHEKDSFRSKQHKSEPPPELHAHPEHTEHPAKQGSEDSDKTGFTTAASSSKGKNVDKSVVGSPGSDNDLQPYETAPETPIKDSDRRSARSKSKAGAPRSMDGALEDVTEEDAPEDPSSQRQSEDSPLEFKDAQEELPTDTRTSLEEKVPENGRQGVEVVEPKAIDADYGQDPALIAD